MRPLKDFFFEEYWEIAYRDKSNGTIFEKNKFDNFKVICATNRYWYADPMLFKYNGETYLFYEAFDNLNRKGVIAYSKYVNNYFTKPKIILEENFHLSYPYVYEENGDIYMMPETSANKCIQIYRAVNFPEKWEKDKCLLKIDNAVDTIFVNKNELLTSIVIDKYKKSTRLMLININDKSFRYITDENQTSRGAGKIFKYKTYDIRPAQDASDGIYGKGLCFYKIDSTNEYKESLFCKFDFTSIDLKNVKGVHTYAVNNDIEIIDCKRKKFNPMLWIYIIISKLGGNK